VKNWRKKGAIIGSIGCIEFVIFSTIAMFFYGGGTSWNKSAEGYTFWHNVLSDLGRTVSYSGLPNNVSSPMFNLALSFFGICIIVIYLSMGKDFLRPYWLMLAILIGGIISGTGVVIIGFAPDDVLPDYHMLGVWMWALPLFSVLLLFIINAVINRIYDNYFFLTCTLAAVLFIHIGQGITGLWSPIVAATQKIVVYFNIIWYLWICRKISTQEITIIS
tara:strand:+ start:170 stop:826 length:657 start_codon:yes stop_codon:yes gene_type:complete